MTHSLIRVKRFPWPVCERCGLILLRNKTTQVAAKGKCRGYFREHVYVVPT